MDDRMCSDNSTKPSLTKKGVAKGDSPGSFIKAPIKGSSTTVGDAGKKKREAVPSLSTATKRQKLSGSTETSDAMLSDDKSKVPPGSTSTIATPTSFRPVQGMRHLPELDQAKTSATARILPSSHPPPVQQQHIVSHRQMMLPYQRQNHPGSHQQTTSSTTAGVADVSSILRGTYGSVPSSNFANILQNATTPRGIPGGSSFFHSDTSVTTGFQTQQLASNQFSQQVPPTQQQRQQQQQQQQQHFLSLQPNLSILAQHQQKEQQQHMESLYAYASGGGGGGQLSRPQQQLVQNQSLPPIAFEAMQRHLLALRQRQQQQQQQYFLPSRAFDAQLPSASSSSIGGNSAKIPTNNLRGVAKSATSFFLSNSSSTSTSTTSDRLLFMESDKQCLSQFQCLARKQIEVFEATQDDVDSGARGRNFPILLGQVGIRCIHCASDKTTKHKNRGAVYFPTKLDRIYQTAINMATIHLCGSCDHIPLYLKQELNRLRSKKSHSGGGKEYCGIGVNRKCGVVEIDGILRFDSNKNEKSKKKNKKDNTRITSSIEAGVGKG